MKKIIIISTMLFVLLSTVGCKEKSKPVINNNDNSLTAEEKPENKEEVKEEEVKEEVKEEEENNIEDNITSNEEEVINTADINSFNDIDASSQSWWFGRNKNFERPNGAKDIEFLKQYNSYYIGEDRKVIYLTFDEGSNESYIDEIVEVLDRNNVKGTFFLTKNYILNNKEFVKQMNQSGHLVGNHSVTHPDMTSLSFEAFKEEIIGVENAFEEATGEKMTKKVFRFPRGVFSEQTLDALNRMGYKSFFWSFAYKDWEEDVSKEEALNWYNNYYHNGALYLIHPKNKGNFEALEDFINGMKENGYEFDLVNSINL